MLVRTALGLALALTVVGCGDTKPKSQSEASTNEASSSSEDKPGSPPERSSLPTSATTEPPGPQPRLALPPPIQKAKRHINKRRGPLPHYQITTDDDGLAKTFAIGADGTRSDIEK